MPADVRELLERIENTYEVWRIWPETRAVIEAAAALRERRVSAKLGRLLDHALTAWAKRAEEVTK